MRHCIVLLTILSATFAGCDSGGPGPATNAVPPQAPPIPPPPPVAANASTPATSPATSESAGSSKSERPAGFAMKNYVGQQPVLIVFNGSQDQSSQKFNDALNQQQAEVDRHGLVIIEVFDTLMAYPNARIRGGEALPAKAASNLVDGYNGGGGTFKTVLIGKDGNLISRGGYKAPEELLAELSSEQPAMP